MWNDTELQCQIENELDWDPAVHTRQLGVVVRNAEVELEGHVDSYAQRCAAERAVWRVAQVRAVKNEIRVDLPFNSMRDDDDIALAAMGALEWNCLVPETVQVQVSDAWVTLSGEVDSAYQKEEAERTISVFRGIKGLRNEITIRPKVALGEVRSNIEDALKRNALAHGGHIKAHVSHGVVSLQGTAGSRAEYEQAMRAAWSAPGVAAVEDHISIGSGNRGGR